MMEGGAKALILKNISPEEYDQIDSTIREKIEAVLNEHIEDYITAKALLESTRGIQRKFLFALSNSLFAFCYLEVG